MSSEEKPSELEPIEKPPEEQTRKEAEEAQRIAELYAQGMTIERIGERLGLSESTVRRRLDWWNAKIGKEPAEKSDIDRISSHIIDFFGSDDAAERIGEITGTNVAVVQGILNRLFKGEATKEELSRLMHNITRGVISYFGGSDILKRFEQLFLPHRHPYKESDIDKALRKQVATKLKGKKKEEKQAA